jgi:hypothetical protein
VADRRHPTLQDGPAGCLAVCAPLLASIIVKSHASSSNSPGRGQARELSALLPLGGQGASLKDRSLRHPREHHEFNSWVFLCVGMGASN